jgi:YgiT-type zinc finger domain-containing protein
VAETRECPMCGERMRPHESQTVEHVPGTAQTTSRTVREWRCPECDYFEEIEDSSAGS